MKRMIATAALAVTLAGPADAARRVICAPDWVSFVPYARGSMNLSNVRFYMRKTDIRQGRLVPPSNGYLHLREGAGWVEKDRTIRVPPETFAEIMVCLGGIANR